MSRCLRQAIEVCSESRDVTYSCIVDTRRNQVHSGSYQFAGNSLRMNDGGSYGRQLR
jgi:hypothetical protein